MRQFESGAVRDNATGKGRCDLLPLSIIANHVLHDADNGGHEDTVILLREIDLLRICGGESCEVASIVSDILHIAAKAMYHGDIIDMLLDVALLYESGAQKYKERNWERGIPCTCFIDSGIRHLLKWSAGWMDEYHDRAFVWNMLGLLWTVTNKPEYNDIGHSCKNCAYFSEDIDSNPCAECKWHSKWEAERT